MARVYAIKKSTFYLQMCRTRSKFTYMKLVIVTGGAAPKWGQVVHEFSNAQSIIAVDSGLEHLQHWGIAPDYIIGDFDSITNPSLLNLYPDSSIIRFPIAKDYSDTELALQKAKSLGSSELVLVGGGEGRLDHTLALVALFMQGANTPIPQRWYTAKECIRVLDSGDYELSLNVGSCVSFFPISTHIGARSIGFKWNIDALSSGKLPFSLSNRVVNPEQQVSIQEGRLLMISSYT